MFKKIVSFIIAGLCLLALITPLQALDNSEDIGLTAEYG